MNTSLRIRLRLDFCLRHRPGRRLAAMARDRIETPSSRTPSTRSINCPTTPRCCGRSTPVRANPRPVISGGGRSFSFDVAEHTQETAHCLGCRYREGSYGARSVGPAVEFSPSYGGGPPFCTPLIDGDRAYAPKQRRASFRCLSHGRRQRKIWGVSFGNGLRCDLPRQHQRRSRSQGNGLTPSRQQWLRRDRW